jgi:hypothetical protein
MVYKFGRPRAVVLTAVENRTPSLGAHINVRGCVKQNAQGRRYVAIISGSRILEPEVVMQYGFFGEFIIIARWKS